MKTHCGSNEIYTYENRMKGPFYEDHTGFF